MVLVVSSGVSWAGRQQRLTRTLPVVSSQRPWDQEQRIGWHFQTLPLKMWWLSDFFSLSLSISLHSLFWTMEGRYKGMMNVTLSPPSRSRDWIPEVLGGISSPSVKLCVSSCSCRLTDRNESQSFRGFSKVKIWKKERRKVGSFMQCLLNTRRWQHNPWLITRVGANITVTHGSLAFWDDFAVLEMRFCCLSFLIDFLDQSLG